MHSTNAYCGSCHVAASEDFLEVAGDTVTESTPKTGGWFQRCLSCLPSLGEMIHFDEHIF